MSLIEANKSQEEDLLEFKKKNEKIQIQLLQKHQCFLEKEQECLEKEQEFLSNIQKLQRIQNFECKRLNEELKNEKNRSKFMQIDIRHSDLMVNFIKNEIEKFVKVESLLRGKIIQLTNSNAKINKELKNEKENLIDEKKNLMILFLILKIKFLNSNYNRMKN